MDEITRIAWTLSQPEKHPLCFKSSALNQETTCQAIEIGVRYFRAAIVGEVDVGFG